MATRLLLFLLLAIHAQATVYWVATNGVDSAAGTYAAPWATVGKAATNCVSGDTVIVSQGTYLERVFPKASSVKYLGTNWPRVLGFDLEVLTNITISGFDISHYTTNYQYAGVYLNTVSYSLIASNYIHDTWGEGITIKFGTRTNNCNIIRSNTIYNAGLLTNYMYGNYIIKISGTNNLIELNRLSWGGDHIILGGDRNIVQSNWFGPTDPAVQSDFIRLNSYTNHIDDIQTYASTNEPVCMNTLFQGNVSVGSVDMNSHSIIIQDTLYLGTGGFIARNNLVMSLGSYASMVQSCPFYKSYNNTYINCNAGNPSSSYGITTSLYSTNSSYFNNIYYSINKTNGVVYGIADNTTNGLLADYNLAWLSGTPNFGTHNIIADPLFRDYANSNYNLSATSPARNAARYLSLVASNVTASAIVYVSDARVFCDGYGVIGGDVVDVGTNVSCTITNVDYTNNIIVLNRAITASASDTVNLHGVTDVGALQYSDYVIAQSLTNPPTITITAPATGSYLFGPRPVTVSTTGGDGVVTNVIYTLNGTTFYTTATAPYSATTAYLFPGSYTLGATVYSDLGLTGYASSTLTVTSTPVIATGKFGPRRMWISPK